MKIELPAVKGQKVRRRFKIKKGVVEYQVKRPNEKWTKTTPKHAEVNLASVVIQNRLQETINYGD